jgi:hypothetical protein
MDRGTANPSPVAVGYHSCLPVVLGIAVFVCSISALKSRRWPSGEMLDAVAAIVTVPGSHLGAFGRG